jgi:catechol 2,3-dioxygenase-like lactoylglutathione lyase family enzyme
VNGGIRGLHHGAINAVDWDASVAFYRDVLGLPLLGTGEASGELMETALSRPGVRLRWAMFAVGDQHFELIGYLEPPAGRVLGESWDGGATHLAFKVRDVDEAYRDLSARGVRFLGEPVRYHEPVPVGGAFAYALDPSGVLLEFIEDVAERR